MIVELKITEWYQNGELERAGLRAEKEMIEGMRLSPTVVWTDRVNVTG
jgi:hypothetical protein